MKTSIMLMIAALFGGISALQLAMPTIKAPASASTIIMTASRRQVISTAAAFAALPSTLGGIPPALADAGKVVIFGGSGYVGAYASKILLEKGVKVVSVSRKSPTEAAEKVSAILGKTIGVEYKTLDATSDDLSGVLAGATAVISCVGIAPGGANQRDGNGKANIAIANAVKAAGIDKFVYLGLASELAGGPIKFIFGDYVKGKAEGEAAVTKNFGASALIIEPGIIAGAPPGEIRPPGPPGMDPVPVEAVARAAVAGALGLKTGKVDGNAAIISAAAVAGI